MIVLFSICSNNYLAQAITLLQSAKRHAIQFEFVLFIVDEQHKDIQYESFGFTSIIFIRDLLPNQYQMLSSKYNIIELNTSIKASCFKYLISRYKKLSYFIYFDPDIKIFSSLEYILSKLSSASIVLTPHILSPIPLDEHTPQENIFLQCGVYNLGFIAVSTKSKHTYKFLDWWEKRLFTQCYVNHNEGLFVDQKWLNLAPFLFSDTVVLKTPGCNMAPWNLHERRLNEKNGKYYVNENHELIFYHFSSIDKSDHDKIAKPYYSRYDFTNREDLRLIYKDYFIDLKLNSYDFYSSIPYQFKFTGDKKFASRRKNNLISYILRLLKKS